MGLKDWRSWFLPRSPASIEPDPRLVFTEIDRALAQVEAEHVAWLQHQMGNVPWESWTSARAGGELASQVLARHARVGDPARWMSLTIEALDQATERFRAESNDVENFGVASVGRPAVVLADLHRALYGFDITRRYLAARLSRELERDLQAAWRSYDYRLDGVFGASPLLAERDAFAAIVTSPGRPQPTTFPAQWMARVKLWLLDRPHSSEAARSGRQAALGVLDRLAVRAGIAN